LFSGGLPALSTRLAREQVLERLDAAARRGNLAGFERRGGEELFEVEAYSVPFDHVLVARAAAAGAGTRLTFSAQMLRKTPAIFAIVLALTIWPGVPLTHSMLVTYFSWYHWPAWVTWAWYMLLTVVPLVWWLPRAVKKSRAAAAEAAREQILKLRTILDGTLTQG
jgi:hypothetical protein